MNHCEKHEQEYLVDNCPICAGERMTPDHSKLRIYIPKPKTQTLKLRKRRKL